MFRNTENEASCQLPVLRSVIYSLNTEYLILNIYILSYDRYLNILVKGIQIATSNRNIKNIDECRFSADNLFVKVI